MTPAAGRFRSSATIRGPRIVFGRALRGDDAGATAESGPASRLTQKLLDQRY